LDERLLKGFYVSEKLDFDREDVVVPKKYDVIVTRIQKMMSKYMGKSHSQSDQEIENNLDTLQGT